MWEEPSSTDNSLGVLETGVSLAEELIVRPRVRTCWRDPSNAIVSCLRD
jgi:hypothetical protein